jgi:hypothetical protein
VGLRVTKYGYRDPIEARGRSIEGCEGVGELGVVRGEVFGGSASRGREWNDYFVKRDSSMSRAAMRIRKLQAL